MASEGLSTALLIPPGPVIVSLAFLNFSVPRSLEGLVMATECGGSSDENLNKRFSKDNRKISYTKTFTLNDETRCVYQRLACDYIFMTEMVLVRTLANAKPLINS